MSGFDRRDLLAGQMPVLNVDIVGHQGKDTLGRSDTSIHVSEQRILQSRRCRIERGVIGRSPSVQPLAQPPHEFADAEIADAQFPDRPVQIGGHEIDQRLRELRPLSFRLGKTTNHEHDMQDDQLIPSFDRVGHAQIAIEHRRTGRRDGCRVELRRDAPPAAGAQADHRRHRLRVPRRNVDSPCRPMRVSPRLRFGKPLIAMAMTTRLHATRSARRLLVAGLSLPLLIAGCTPIIANRGNMLDEERIAQVKPGSSSKNDVFEALGSPSVVSTFDDNTWYYVGQRTAREAFFTPQVTDRKIIAVQFDDTDHVKAVERIGLDQAVNVVPLDKKTPAVGRDITFLEQLLGNIGRPSSKKKKKSSEEEGGGS